VGAYRDDKGNPYVLPSVRIAERRLLESDLNKEYAGITGVTSFTKAAARLAYGSNSAPLKEGRVAITQSISGTGALRIGGAFLERFYPGGKKIYIPTPSWANHNAVFSDSKLQVEKYRYYNKDTISLDFKGMIADIKAAPKGSIFLLHACAHNPTGIDPTEPQWREISNAIKEGDHFAFFDMAYQGFASGDTDKDAFAVRHFIDEGHNVALAQSFAKNMVCRGRLNSRVYFRLIEWWFTFRLYMVSALVRSPSSAGLQKNRSAWTHSSRSSFDPCTPTLLSMELALHPRY
jgi:aspartate aminotransferase